MFDECRILQQEEFEVLESIYPEYVSSQPNESTLKLEIPIEFGRVREVVISRNAPEAELGDRDSESVVEVSTLPPLLVHISLPPAYPLQEPPQLLSLRATHLWLPGIGLLNKLLHDMWQAGDGILYMWIEYLRTGEFMQALGLAESDTSVVKITHSNPQSLAPLIADHDIISKASQFAENAYPCSVCLTSLKGSKCLQLSCNHIFCRPCLQDFWGLCIEEGDVSRVGCPDPVCVKEKREANEEEVARIVSDAEVVRWRWLREKRDLEADPTMIHCPIDVCQAPVTKPANEDDESGWARFRQCPRCMFSFCSFCRRTWHGSLTPCRLAATEEVVLKYLAQEEGSKEREMTELRYGRDKLLKLAERFMEEKANEEWLEKSTTMTCWKCRKYFCYLCGTALSKTDPYAHFSQPGRCYGKLYDYEEEEY